MDARPCAHEVTFGGLCASCGEIVQHPGALSAETSTTEKWQRPGFLTTSCDVRVSPCAMKHFEEAERRRRSSMQRLVLVLDIDHTLLVTSTQPRHQSAEQLGPGLVACALPGAGNAAPYAVRLRPHLHEFLRQALGFSELYLYTHGTCSYARAVVNLIDPSGAYFGSPPRLFHRDNTPHGLKSLREIFPTDTSHALVVDDRDEVWSKEVRDTQLVKVSPYLYFGGDQRANISLEGHVAACQARVGVPLSRGCKRPRLATQARTTKKMATIDGHASATHGEEGGAAAGSQAEPADPDAQLLFLARILRRIHRATFANAPGERAKGATASPGVEGAAAAGDGGEVPAARHVGGVLPSLRRRALRGCVVCLTGLPGAGPPAVPGAGPPAPRDPLAWWCEHLGASVSEEVSSCTTHLVAGSRDTRKYHLAVQMRGATGLQIVHPGWVLRAAATWQLPEAGLFAVPGEGAWPLFLEVWMPPDGAAGGEGGEEPEPGDTPLACTSGQQASLPPMAAGPACEPEPGSLEDELLRDLGCA